MRDCQWCFTHNPETSDAHRVAVLKGGLAQKKRLLDLPAIPIKTPQDVVLLLQETINLVRSASMDLRSANCIGFLSGHLLRALETSNLEKRVEEIESILEHNK